MSQQQFVSQTSYVSTILTYMPATFLCPINILCLKTFMSRTLYVSKKTHNTVLCLNILCLKQFYVSKHFMSQEWFSNRFMSQNIVYVPKQILGLEQFYVSKQMLCLTNVMLETFLCLTIACLRHTNCSRP